jgi:membrane-associated phospholipid phosphatase
VDRICEISAQLSSIRMKIIQKTTLILFLFIHIIYAKEPPDNWQSYWVQSGKDIIMDPSSQWLLGSAAIVALGVTKIDMDVKDFVQSNKILSDPISHFGDEIGGNWGHWLLWSSIYLNSKVKNDTKTNLISKMQFSTFAMLTNGIITVGMKRAFGRERPNGSCCQSFPSGHTSHSYTIAAIAHELYGDTVGAVVYGLATLVAASRMNDNKHYLSDVIFGAALGTAVGQSFAKNYHKFENSNLQIGLASQMRFKISIPIY